MNDMTSPFEEWWQEHQHDAGVTEQLDNTRTLRARHTPEVLDDLRSVYGLDIEAELSNIMSEDIATEMSLNPINIPTLRRVMPRLLAEDIVGVQPMAGDSGFDLTFALRYVPETDSKHVVVTREKKDHFDEDLFTL